MEYIFPPWKLFIRINSSVSSWLCKQTLVVPAARYRISSEILSIPVSKAPPSNLVSTTCSSLLITKLSGLAPPLPSFDQGYRHATQFSSACNFVSAREQGITCGFRNQLPISNSNSNLIFPYNNSNTSSIPIFWLVFLVAWFIQRVRIKVDTLIEDQSTLFNIFLILDKIFFIRWIQWIYLFKDGDKVAFEDSACD